MKKMRKKGFGNPCGNAAGGYREKTSKEAVIYKKRTGLRHFALNAAILLLAAAALVGCSTGVTPEASSDADAVSGSGEHSLTVFAMDTVMNITYYDGTEGGLENSIESEIKQLESLFSVTDENSEIYAVNRDKKGKLSADTSELAAFALEMCERTEGALDISVYPVVREWGFTTGEFRVPDSAVLTDLLSRVDYKKVKLDEEKGSLILEKDMMIDLGSVAKGYTGDKVIELLRNAGVTSALLDLGGNIQTLGSKTDGTDWRVAVQDPDGGDYLGIVSVSDMAVITSGGYERYFTDSDGRTYWHIIDPNTGMPAENGLISVTVISENGAYCDALSTSLFVMGRERAVEFWKESRNFDMILVSDDGNVSVTEGIADKFSLANDRDYSLNVVLP